MSRLRHRLGHLRGDRGAVSVFVIGMVVTLLVVGGLVVDGGRAINARQRISDDVEQAARVGAQQIDINALRAQGVVVLNPGAARDSATAYLVGLGYAPGDVAVTVNGRGVTVHAKDVVPTQLLSLIYKDDFPVAAQATARAAVGIDAEVP